MAPWNLQPLPQQAMIDFCTEQHMPAFKRMNKLLLPIPYRDDWYKETIKDPVIVSITRVALWDDTPTPTTKAARVAASSTPRVVAAIRCRLMEYPPDNPGEKCPVLYISTLTTLAPFRQHGFAGHLLSVVTRSAAEEHGVKAIAAHVWEANDDGLEWYNKRGFRVVGKDDMYYRRLAPRTTAYLIRRDIGPTELLAWNQETRSSNNVAVE